MLSAFSKLSLGTKLSLISVVLLFMAVPITVLSANAIRDGRIKADSIGDPNYPDPLVNWTLTPHWQVQLCNSGQAMDDKSQCQIADTDGFGQGTSQPQYKLYQGGTDRRFDSYVKLLVKDPSNTNLLKWVVYENHTFQGGCAAGVSLCDKIITWSIPNVAFTAKYAGQNKSVCQDGPATCVSSVTVPLRSSLPYATAQFKDFPNSISFDVEVSINSNLMDLTSLKNQQSGSVQQLGAPNLHYPQNNANIAKSAFNTFRLTWSTVPGASYYAVWISTNDDFGKGGFWWKKVQAGECSTSCNKGLIDGGWTTQAGSDSNLGIPPGNIEAGKTYYWIVWACTVGNCPNSGVSARNVFTTEATSSPTQPTNPTPQPQPSQPKPVETITPNSPILSTPSLANNGTPTPDVDTSPVFRWDSTVNATTYVVAVSDDYNKLNDLTGYWASYLADSSCNNGQCSRNWSDSANWATFRNIVPRSATLKPGQVYHWSVRACNPDSCSLPSTSSFRTKGDVTETGPTNLSDSPLGGEGGHTFYWYQAGSPNRIFDYTIFLKSKNGDFLGDYWQKTRISCSSNPCSTDLGGTWTYYKNNEPVNSSSPPKPLSAGDWYFVVFACKVNEGCITRGLSSFLSSDIKKFTVSSDRQTIKPPDTGSGGQASGGSSSGGGGGGGVSTSYSATITQTTPAFSPCKNGKIDVTFNWAPSTATNITSQYLDLSLYDNNFLENTFLSSNPPPAVGAKSYAWPGLLASRVHFWRINTNIDGQWYTSNVANFKTPNCPDLTASSTGGGGGSVTTRGLGRDLIYDSDPTAIKNYLKSYIDSLQGNKVDPHNPDINLVDIMTTVMGAESHGGEDCAYHVDTDGSGNPTQSTVGIFQFTPDLWQGSANHGTDDALDYTDSGSIVDAAGNKKVAGCWKTPGGDDVLSTSGRPFWANAFLGAGYDAGAWDPYAQVRVAVHYFIDGYACRWSGYKVNYSGCS